MSRLIRRMNADAVELSPDGKRIVFEDYDSKGDVRMRVSIPADHPTIRALAWACHDWLKRERAAVSATANTLEGK